MLWAGIGIGFTGGFLVGFVVMACMAAAGKDEAND